MQNQFTFLLQKYVDPKSIQLTFALAQFIINGFTNYFFSQQHSK